MIGTGVFFFFHSLKLMYVFGRHNLVNLICEDPLERGFGNVDTGVLDRGSIPQVLYWILSFDF